MKAHSFHDRTASINVRDLEAEFSDVVEIRLM
jgi:hypothetical protein